MTDIKDLEKALWTTADNLRNKMDAAESKHALLGLSIYRFLIYFVLATQSFCLYSQENLPVLVNTVLPSIVTIYTYNEDGALSQGTGFFITKDGHLVTNHHVLRGASYAEVRLQDGKEFLITHIIAENSNSDIIRVKVDIPEEYVNPLSVVSSLPSLGERIVVVGSPEGLVGSVSDGIVSAIREIPNIGKIIQISAPISSGSSGSPIINMEGKVIGIATSSYREGQNLNFAMTGESIIGLEYSPKPTPIDKWNTLANIFESNNTYDDFRLGMDYLWAENYRSALIYFLEVIKKDSSHSSAHFYSGYCYAELGLHRKAIEALTKAIEIDPHDASAYYNRGFSKDELNDHYGAIADYTKAIEIDPRYAKAYYNRGFSKDELNDHYGAIADYTKAIEIDPDDAKAYHNRGFSKDELNDHYGAIADFTKAIEIDPNYARAYLNRGYSKSDLNDHYGAIADYTKAIEIDPDDARAYLNRGYSKSDLNDHYGAIADFTKAIEIDPNYARAYLNRGLMWLIIEHSINGCRDLRKAAELGHERALELIRRNCH